MAISVEDITADQAAKVMAIEEGQFDDLKAIEIAPGKLTKHMSAFANSDGGDLYIGIDEVGSDKRREWRGFDDQEAANGHLQAFEQFFPLGTDFQYEFLKCSSHNGIVLHVSISKTLAIKSASSGNTYVRRGAQSLEVKTEEQLAELKFTKGLASFETETVKAPVETITNSEVALRFMLEVVPTAEPETWLRKQKLIVAGNPTVAGVLLFAEEPQAVLPKHCGIKVYQYKTNAAEGFRDALAFTPKTVEGDLYSQINAAVALTAETIASTPRINEEGQLEAAAYPTETLHEVITNAVLHRDYSITDDVHIRIFENRVEVQSPGKLPAHITIKNILDERFARNGTVVRLLNKFPNPPNQDVGEGLNTAFLAMKNSGLKEPVIAEAGNSVVVVIKHEPLASAEEAIMEYLETHSTINNKEARQVTHIQQDWQVKAKFNKMVEAGLIEQVPGSVTSNTRYQKAQPKASP
jgi:ATP-dependent DNA helicase RecG